MAFIREVIRSAKLSEAQAQNLLIDMSSIMLKGMIGIELNHTAKPGCQDFRVDL